MRIHPTAVVHPAARLHPSIEVGPLAVIDAEVELGEDCWVGPHVHLTGATKAGMRNQFHTGCVIGGPPQDLRFSGGPTRLEIGDDNTFREHVTLHCANSVEEETRIGSGNLFMAQAHVGHNCRIGNGVIMANSAQLGGHAVIGDRAFISSTCLVHQFVRVGTLSLMQGGSAISLDLPPFCIARGNNSISGLNVVGLRRAGLGPEIRLELRQIYHAMFRSRQTLKRRLEATEPLVITDWGRRLVDFVRTSHRGIVSERGRTVRIE